MLYTHTLSIQNVNAILQMKSENSSVSYTLTLRTNSGEEVVTNGNLPTDVIDHFIVINQHFKNPSDVKNTIEQGVQANLTECIKTSNVIDVQEYHLNNDQEDPNTVEEKELYRSHTDISVLNELNTNHLQETDSLSESLSSISSFTPRSMVEENVSEEKMVEPKQEQPLIEQNNDMIPTHEMWLIKNIELIRTSKSFMEQHHTLFEIKEYIIKYDVKMTDYPSVRNTIIETCYWLTRMMIGYSFIINRCEEVMQFLGEPRENILDYIQMHIKQWHVFYNVADRFDKKMNLPTKHKYYQMYQEWRQKGTHSNLNRWKAMEFWFRTMRPADE